MLHRLDERDEHEHEPLVESAEAPEKAGSLACGIIFSIACTLSAGAVVHSESGNAGVMTFVAAYLMELSLSVDNMFAFYLIFKYYACPAEAQQTCLFWGIASAVVLRACILIVGTALVTVARPLMLLFAALLVWTAWHTFAASADDDDALEDNRVVRCLQWLRLPVTKEYHGAAFIAREEDGSLRATPLVLVLATIELSDILFAADSVPAVLGLSNDLLVTYLAVLCAVVGLRTLYALTVRLLRSFAYLQYAVALLLVFIGSKIVLDVLLGVTVSPRLSLGVIGCTLAGGLVASVVCGPRREESRREDDAL